MPKSNAPSLLDQCRDKLRELVAKHQLDSAAVTVLAKPLTPEEAIGTPTRRDYPILEGKERVIEASLLGAQGQAFTDAPSDFTGQLRDVFGVAIDYQPQSRCFPCSDECDTALSFPG